MGPKSQTKTRQASKQHNSPSRNAYAAQELLPSYYDQVYDNYLRSFMQSAYEYPKSRHASQENSPVLYFSHSSVVDPYVVRVLEDSQQYRNYLIYSILARTQYSGGPSIDVLRRLSLVEQRLGIYQPYQDRGVVLCGKALARANLRVKLLEYRVQYQNNRFEVYGIYVREFYNEAKRYLATISEQHTELHNKVAYFESGMFELQKCVDVKQLDPKIQALEAKQNKIIQIIRSYKDAIQGCIERQEGLHRPKEDYNTYIINATASCAKQIQELANSVDSRLSAIETKVDALCTCYEESLNRIAALENSKGNTNTISVEYELRALKLENTNMLLLINYMRKYEDRTALKTLINEIKDETDDRLQRFCERIEVLEDYNIKDDVDTLFYSLDEISAALQEHQERFEDLNSQVLNLRLPVCHSDPEGIDGKASIANAVEYLEIRVEYMYQYQTNTDQMQPVIQEFSKQIGIIAEYVSSYGGRLDSLEYYDSQSAGYYALESYCQNHAAYTINMIAELRDELSKHKEYCQSQHDKYEVLATDYPQERAHSRLEGAVRALYYLKDSLEAILYQAKTRDTTMCYTLDTLQVSVYNQRDTHEVRVKNVEHVVEEMRSSVNQNYTDLNSVKEAYKGMSDQLNELYHYFDFIQKFFTAGFAQMEEYSEEDDGADY